MACRILVLEPVAATRALLVSILSANQYQPLIAENIGEAKQLFLDQRPEIVLARTMGEDPIATVTEILDCATAGDASPPPIICLDCEADPDRRLAVLAAGARDMLQYPVNSQLLLAHLRGLLREVNSRREIERRKTAAAVFGFAEAATRFLPSSSVALVADLKENSFASSLIEKDRSIRVLEPTSALTPEAFQSPIDVFVVDGQCLGADRTLEITADLRSRDHSRHAAVLVAVDKDQPELAVQALDRGASDVVWYDARSQEISIRLKALQIRKAAEDALRRSSENSLELAVTDPLTGLFNRRYAQAYLSDTIASSVASGEPFTVMLVDIDHFKKINDQNGHSSGDAVLCAIARRMRKNLRAIDLVARYGGEEFLIVLPGTDRVRAGPAANRLRQKIGGEPVKLADGRDVMITVSIGVAIGGIPSAETQSTASSPQYSVAAQHSNGAAEKLVDAADTALYAAKSAGRNRIKLAAISS